MVHNVLATRMILHLREVAQQGDTITLHAKSSGRILMPRDAWESRSPPALNQTLEFKARPYTDEW